MKIQVSPCFQRSYRKLPQRIKEIAGEKELIFRKNPFDSRLKTHKLSGKDKECLAFWITHSYRIKFIFLSAEEVLFLDIGTHEIYK